MISVEQAKDLLFNQISNSGSIDLEIVDALGFILSTDIYSPIDQPSFTNSAMDGYAVSSNEERLKFKVIGEIKAGDSILYTLNPGEAVRVFTGAQIPDSADSIIIQENVEIENGYINVIEPYKNGAFIRNVGSMMKKGDIALKKGTLLNAASIGFLASMGLCKVSVCQNPRISIITTGDEIVKPGNELKPGQIYESNSYSLAASLRNLNIKPTSILKADDNKEHLRVQIKSGLLDSDILILTGGISVGKYDLVYETLKEFGVEPIFYKVAQKPGKPFFAGKLNHKLIFALPGNPAAVLVCFYEYIFPVIRIMQGHLKSHLKQVKFNLLKTIRSYENRSQFIRAKIMNGGIMPLEGQDSFMLHSFALADALIYVPNGTHIIEENEEVEVHLLPH